MYHRGAATMDAAADAHPGTPDPLRTPTIVLCVMNVAGVLFYEDFEGLPRWIAVLIFAAAYVVVVAVSFVVIWCFWRRQNWARYVVLATSVLALANLRSVPSATPVAQALLVAEAAFGAWLLYWLNTRPIAALFTPRTRRPSLQG